MEHIAVLWFRNDLRLHDNEALVEATQKAKYILPVYVFDERVFYGKTNFGYEKIAKFRTKFIIEAVADLRENLRKKGSDLIIRIGKPEDEVFKIAKSIKSSWVYCNRERTQEEVDVQDQLEQNLWTIRQELRFARGKMLYHTADLPFPVCQVPDVFTNFRKEIENTIQVRPPFETPLEIPYPANEIDKGSLPSLVTFDKEEVELTHIENRKFAGGESHALNQLQEYFWESKRIENYKETRNEMLGWQFSSKFSAWLSIGCISPKYIYSELQEYEKNVKKNDSTYWLYFELLWRDFFRLIGKKYGNRIFAQGGTRDIDPGGSTDVALFTKWAQGNTGFPLIDANMRQLNQTGFMSNRGRQNVASFLVKDMKMNWLMGAEYFESLLIDYDPCSNYGNWNYVAGVGNDPREDRYFNILTQSKRYDPQGSFIKYWLPELKNVPVHKLHQPDEMSVAEQAAAKVIIGKDYPGTITRIRSLA
jgi:deoxyribodipyrimidine photo-lyase